MIKRGIINPEVNYNLSMLTHMDKFLVSDSAMELPKEMNRIDLAFTPNVPDVITITKGILEDCLIEKAYMAEEMREVSNELYNQYVELLTSNNVPSTFPLTLRKFCVIFMLVDVDVKPFQVISSPVLYSCLSFVMLLYSVCDFVLGNLQSALSSKQR